MEQSGWNKGTVQGERRCRYRFHGIVACILAGLCAAAAPFASAAQSEKAKAPEPGKKIRILVVVEATSPLAVDYRTTGRRLRGTIAAGSLGILPILIESKVSSSERSQESKRLQETVGAFDRRPLIEAAIAAAFKATTPYFEAVIPQDPTLYAGEKEVNFNKAQADGHPYVLVVREEFAGMITAWAMNTLSAGSYLRFRLYDAATKKQLAKGEITGFGLPQHPLDPATTDRSIFLAEYPAAVGAACGRIYGELNKQGHLHTMAEAHGLGKEVPAIGALLEKYANLFKYDFKLPKDWHQSGGASKYSLILEPKSADRAKFGVSFAVDLLIEEFGQNVKDVDEYIRIVFGRLRNLGYAVDTAQPFDGLALNPPHVAFLIDRPNGAGKEVVVFRRLDDRFVVIYSIVFLEDFDGFLKKYGRDIESLINRAEITTRS